MEYLSVQEAARQWGVSVATVRRMLDEGQLGQAAFKVRRQWRILATAVPRRRFEPRSTKRIRGKGAIGEWEAEFTPQLAVFVAELIQRVQPRFIIVRHRKGERVFAALQLLPEEVLPTVFELEYFLLMPPAERKAVLSNAVVLVLDDTMQSGRYSQWMREWFERQAPNVQVRTACLFIRRSLRVNQELAVPDVEAFQELDDYEFRLATAELSRVYRSLWPLDLEHPTVSVTLPDEWDFRRVANALSPLGRLIELPPLVSEEQVRVLVVEDLPDSVLRGLDRPRIIGSWPPKLRCIWVEETRRLVLAGIWFPSIRATQRWLSAFRPDVSSDWYPYLGLDEPDSWSHLDAGQRAHRLFRAFALYGGARIVAHGLAAIAVAGGTILSSRLLDDPLAVEDEDYVRVYGRSPAERILEAIRLQMHHDARRAVAAMQSPSLPLDEPPISTPVAGFTIREFVDPLVRVFKKFPGDLAGQDDEPSSPLTWGVLEVEAEKIASSLDKRVIPDETRSPRWSSQFSSRVDVGVDYGYLSPRNVLITTQTERSPVITVGRGYEAGELSKENSVAETDGTLATKRLVFGVPVLLSRFQEAAGLSLGVPRLVFHKLFVNLQAGLSSGFIDAKGAKVDRTLILEVAEPLGPMSYTPPRVTPHDNVDIDSFLVRRGVLRREPGQSGDDSRLVVLPQFDAVKVLPRFVEYWGDTGDALGNHAELVGHLYAGISKSRDYRGPTAGDLLTALASCSTEERFLRYSIEDIKIWAEAGTGVVSALTSGIDVGAPSQIVIEELRRLHRACSALSNKLKWYATIPSWRAKIEETALPGHLQSTRISVLKRVAAAPVWDRESGPCARQVLAIEPMMQAVSSGLRYIATDLGVAGGMERQPRASAPCSRFHPLDRNHSWCNLAECMLALRAQGPFEVEAVSDSVAYLQTWGGAELESVAASALSQVWSKVDELAQRVVRQPSRRNER